MGVLVGVCIPEKSKRFLLPPLEMMDLNVELICLSRNSWVNTIENFLKNNQVDSVWVLTFPWFFPKSVLELLDYGFVNFHFGLLPQYKGNDPIFWQFKNKEVNGGVTIHYINEDIDEGPVILQEKIPIIPGETYGLHSQRLGLHNTTLINKVIRKQVAEEFSSLVLEFDGIVYSKKPDEKDLIIDWENQTSDDIEYLVNASNPKYGGAKTTINGLELFILEVAPVDMEQKIIANPGQIIHADAIYGLIVYCSDDRCIRITVTHTREGFLSGVKLFNMGIRTGNAFGRPVDRLETIDLI
ncbi:hypothetical protein BZG01_17960 [Labilibaculum manganireducens]|uniref:Methionyl-tRNA formyltransferase n=2 Tax=Labilibaculum manganireducens TaxID=1940525 RepID=A0A2N3HVK9_9BACT|nr:hypothetical protein BZG01_17960 [Labilibaculum manganireducens]